ncbi:MAG: YlxR family protein [Acidimicrobiales bacterium]
MGCQRVAQVAELLRVVCDADGALVLGTGLPGRGAWLCRDSPGCVELAARRRAFSRSLRAQVTAEAVDDLRVKLSSHGGATSQ